MTLNQLIYMKTIIEEQSFTQTSEVLHISQSCLSKQMSVCLCAETADVTEYLEILV